MLSHTPRAKALSIFIFLFGSIFSFAQKQLKAAAGSTPHATITVDRPFSEGMARNARLDITQPQLSDDGVRADATKTLASSECLLFETLVAEGDNLTAAQTRTFCDAAANANTEDMDKVKLGLEEHAKTQIDDALIHLVVWDGTKHTPQGQWYHYERHAGKWSGSLFSFEDKSAVRALDYVLGHGNVAFLAVHLGIDDSCGITYDIEAKHTSGINRKDLADLFQLVKDYYGKGTSGTAKNAAERSKNPPPPGPYVGVWGGETLLRLPKLPASISIKPSTGKTVGDANVRTDWSVKSGCKAEQATKTGKQNEASNRMRQSHAQLRAAVAWSNEINPVEPAAAQGATKASDSSDKSKDPLSEMGVDVPNEGPHWWDVSVALPVTSYNKLKFDSQNNFVTVKNTNDIKPYGLVDLYIPSANLQAKKALSPPRLSAGLPMASKPLQQPFVGGGFTLAIGSFRFSPLVGIRIQKEQRTTTLTAGAPANGAQLTNDLHSEWHAKLQVMIGFSIQDARKALGLK